MIFSTKKPKVFLLFVMIAAVFLVNFTLPVLARESANLGDTAPAEAPDAQWTGKADGVVEGTSGMPGDASGGGVMGEITDSLMGDTGTGSMMNGAENGTADSTGGTTDTKDTEAVTGDMATDTAASSSGSGSDDGMSVFGVIITILIILAVIALIIALIPKRKMQ